MRKYLYLFALSCLSFSCSDKETPCGKINCPGTEKPISIATVNDKGEPTEAVYVEIENKRTGKIYKDLQKGAIVLPGRVSYLVIIPPEQFSGGGDVMTISVTSKSGKVYTQNVTIKGGYCTCEAQKISGPDTIVID